MEPGIPDSESFAGVFTLFNNELHTKAPELSYKTRQQAALKVCWYSCKSSSSFFNSPRLLSSNYFSDCILGFLPQSYLKMLSDEFEIGTLLQLLVWSASAFSIETHVLTTPNTFDFLFFRLCGNRFCQIPTWALKKLSEYPWLGLVILAITWAKWTLGSLVSLLVSRSLRVRPS